ncbi:MAG: hypothetical protein ACT4ON_13605 [Bacteroidota bacterium]
MFAKEIRLTNTTKIGKTYQIYLGNGTINTFTSERDAKYFLAATNNFLTDKLHDLHQTYVDVWNRYQENWFYFENSRTTGKSELYAMERNCSKQLDSIRALLDFSVQRCGFTNGNYFVFINFQKITEYLEDIIRLLAEMYGKHSNTNAISKMDVLIRRVLYTRNELANHAKRSTTKLFRIPTHISEDKDYIPELVSLQVA